MRSPEAALCDATERSRGCVTWPARPGGPTLRAIHEVVRTSVLAFVYDGLREALDNAAIGAKWALRAIAKEKLS